MNVLETITVRLHDLKNAPLLKDTLTHLSLPTTLAPIRIDFYQNAAVQNDWLVQIIRPAERIIAAKSPFAVSLAESFRPIGMVHHSVLVPMPLSAKPSGSTRDRPEATPLKNRRHAPGKQKKISHSQEEKC